MDATKFNEKALSNYLVAYFFSAVKSFEERVGAADCGLERFQWMRDEYNQMFKAFDEAYKRTQKSELTAKIAALDKERDGYAYVIQKVAEAWAAKIEDESLAVHGVRVAQVFRDYGFARRRCWWRRTRKSTIWSRSWRSATWWSTCR